MDDTNKIITEANRYIADSIRNSKYFKTYQCSEYPPSVYKSTLIKYLNATEQYRFLVRIAYYGSNRYYVCIRWCDNKDYRLFIDNVGKIIEDIPDINKQKGYPFITEGNLEHFCFYLSENTSYRFDTDPKCRYVEKDGITDFVIHEGYVKPADKQCYVCPIL